ncbi:jg424 [Pararge aegeria aegeria]|uniref:Jg424 protein n=1 Tax=Pararge aegeria aegeria TaxID=348720 RepID=A0A8S4QAV8_9NEOP|nr:jg424 [Pararge aegeria aegeria]
MTDHLSLPFHLYADDFQIYVSALVADVSEAVEQLNADLSAICGWSKSYGLLVNGSKSQAIIFGNPRQIAEINFSDIPPVTFAGSVLPYNRTVKNLGILMESNLSWRPQIAHISQKEGFRCFCIPEMVEEFLTC